MMSNYLLQKSSIFRIQESIWWVVQATIRDWNHADFDWKVLRVKCEVVIPWFQVWRQLYARKEIDQVLIVLKITRMSVLTSQQMWMTFWCVQVHAIVNNINVAKDSNQTFGYTAASSLELCYYPIYPSDGTDTFDVVVGQSGSKTQYSLFVRTETGELKNIGTSYSGTLSAVSKNHKEFYILVLPMKSDASVKFYIQNGNPSKDSHTIIMMFFVALLLIILCWVFAIIGWLFYNYYLKHKLNYERQVDQDTFEESNASKRSARDVTASMLVNQSMLNRNPLSEKARVEYSRDQNEYRNLRFRIKGDLIAKDQPKCDKMSKEERERLAGWISLNCARALFSFLRSIETEEDIERGRYYEPTLFIPEENPFFNVNHTYYRKDRKVEEFKSRDIDEIKSNLK